MYRQKLQGTDQSSGKTRLGHSATSPDNSGSIEGCNKARYSAIRMDGRSGGWLFPEGQAGSSCPNSQSFGFEVLVASVKIDWLERGYGSASVLFSAGGSMRPRSNFGSLDGN